MDMFFYLVYTRDTPKNIYLKKEYPFFNVRLPKFYLEIL